jgi:hypothetical protein
MSFLFNGVKKRDPGIGLAGERVAGLKIMQRESTPGIGVSGALLRTLENLRRVVEGVSRSAVLKTAAGLQG